MTDLRLCQKNYITAPWTNTCDSITKEEKMYCVPYQNVTALPQNVSLFHINLTTTYFFNESRYGEPCLEHIWRQIIWPNYVILLAATILCWTAILSFQIKSAHCHNKWTSFFLKIWYQGLFIFLLPQHGPQLKFKRCTKTVIPLPMELLFNYHNINPNV
jgi:hypothetical protein